MKILDLALKDLKRNFRSAFGLVMMFVAPLLITGLIDLAFGGIGSESGIQVPVTRIQAVNLDDPVQTVGGGLSIGQMLMDSFRDEQLASSLQVTETDEATARAAVAQEKADVAILIPAGLTEAAFTSDQAASITLVEGANPSAGAGLVKGIVSGYLEGFAGTRIAADVTAKLAALRNIKNSDALVKQVRDQYAQWARVTSAQLQSGQLAELRLESPAPAPVGQDATGQMMGRIMVGMMVFFVFFTGANTAESIIIEQEEGTLARLLTTPTGRSTILGGKLTAVFFTLIVQLAVLLISAGLLFHIRWGEWMPMLLMSVGLIAAAAGFGVFVMSFIKNTRQTGPVLGGVLTITGMLGGVMTAFVPNMPKAFTTVNLFTPHGWAMRGWGLVLAGHSLGEVVPTALITLAWGAALFVVGVILFRKRLA